MILRSIHQFDIIFTLILILSIMHNIEW